MGGAIPLAGRPDPARPGRPTIHQRRATNRRPPTAALTATSASTPAVSDGSFSVARAAAPTSRVTSDVTMPTAWSPSIPEADPPNEVRRCNSVATRVDTNQDATLAGWDPTLSARNA